jgi:hypothetical protein
VEDERSRYRAQHGSSYYNARDGGTKKQIRDRRSRSAMRPTLEEESKRLRLEIPGIGLRREELKLESTEYGRTRKEIITWTYCPGDVSPASPRCPAVVSQIEQ